jgi:hypothetical protein
MDPINLVLLRTSTSAIATTPSGLPAEAAGLRAEAAASISVWLGTAPLFAVGVLAFLGLSDRLMLMASCAFLGLSTFLTDFLGEVTGFAIAFGV